jgi:hypothetical protein
MADVYVSYSPNDFFYAGIDQVNINGTNHLKPTDAECTQLLKKNWDSSACITWFSDNKENCIKHHLCQNKKNAQNIYDEDTAHNSGYSKHLDNQVDFQNTFLNTINLSIGIVFLFFVIYKIQTPSTK